MSISQCTQGCVIGLIRGYTCPHNTKGINWLATATLSFRLTANSNTALVNLLYTAQVYVYIIVKWTLSKLETWKGKCTFLNVWNTSITPGIDCIDLTTHFVRTSQTSWIRQSQSHLLFIVLCSKETWFHGLLDSLYGVYIFCTVEQTV